MKNRPLLFIILGLLHIAEPIFKVLYFKANTGFSFSLILNNIFQMNGIRQIFEFWFLFPIGGLALFGVKKWSYPVFVGVQVYSVFTHLNYESFTWPYVSNTPQWPSLAILSCNIGMILYFLLPEIRKPFFDKDMRWWEHRERYTLRIPCSFSSSNNNSLQDAEILNISLSGAFMQVDHKNFKQGDRITVNLSFLDEHISLRAKIVSLHSFEEAKGVGLMFEYETIWEQLHMTKIIKIISKATKKHYKQAMAA
ncbi:PilZ domain-containing protein [Halobacteriovorax sp. HLS]|uniref:PilZ domain-containing protein n=1 Tax=Halobacteriovorax sp. HLS TaxID=2234000 RepID=UPI000FD9BE7C|nr:PilZ domain-containing protein [Halobacteriovorax sp. HLS]